MMTHEGRRRAPRPAPEQALNEKKAAATTVPHGDAMYATKPASATLPSEVITIITRFEGTVSGPGCDDPVSDAKGVPEAELPL